MATTRSVKDRIAALNAQASDETLAESLRQVDAMEPDPARNWMRHQILAELEQRHPEVDAIIQSAYDEADKRMMASEDADVDEVAVLLGALGL